MAFLFDLLSDFGAKDTRVRYPIWVQTVEIKTQRLMVVLGLVQGRSGGLVGYRENVNKMFPLLNQLVLDLEVTQFMGDSMSCSLIQQMRTTLLNLWQKLLPQLDEIEDPALITLILEAIHRMMTRLEFDPAQLDFDESGHPRCLKEIFSVFSRYRLLLVSTHVHIVSKLSSKVPILNSSEKGLDVMMAYAKILSVNFFRLPEVGCCIMQHFSSLVDKTVTYKLTKYEEKHGKKKRKTNKTKDKTTKTMPSLATPHLKKEGELSSIESNEVSPRPFTGDRTEKKLDLLGDDSHHLNGIDVDDGYDSGNGSDPETDLGDTLSSFTFETFPKQKLDVQSASYLETNFSDSPPTDLLLPIPNPVLQNSSQTEVDDGITVPTKELTIDEIEPTVPFPEDSSPPLPVQSKGLLSEPSVNQPIPLEKVVAQPLPDTKKVPLQSQPEKVPLQPQPEATPILPSLDEKKEKEDPTGPKKKKKNRVHHQNSSHPELANCEIKADPLDQAIVDKVILSHPKLFNWGQFHSALHSSPISVPPSATSQKENSHWLNWLTPKSIFLMTFIKNWVEHVETIFTSPVFISFYKNTAKMINPQKYICWRAIPGYPQILELFLHILRDRPRFGTHFIAACKAMLHSEPLLINYYNRVVLSRTPLFSFSQVSTTLVRIQSWMQEFQKMNKPLTSRFDWKYFCCALDVLISIDHHQVLQKILTLFFEVSDVFTGDLRKTILSDFLFKKYFFRFFLHWDEITRNYFHQFLLWRAIRMKISQLSLPKSFENMSFIGKDLVLKTFQNVDPDIEMNSDLAMLGKIQCYIQVIKEQVKDPLGETYEKSLETYVPRAIAEYEFFVAKYKEWEDKDNKEWRLLPLVFLDAKRRSSLHPNLTSERPT